MAESKGKGDIQEDEGRNKAIPQDPKTIPQPESSPFDAYEKGTEGGVAVIINNVNFAKSGFAKRKGSTRDADLLWALLNELDFEIIRDETTMNLSGDGIKKKLKEVSERKELLQHACCFVCIILSYGDEGHVYGIKDEHDKKHSKLEINDIMEPFKGDKCGPLIGTPKLFFVQTCPEKPGGPQAECEGVHKAKALGQKIPVEADQLLVHSCIPGDKQWDKNEPSSFIWELTDAITDAIKKSMEKYSERRIHFLSTLAKMNGKLVAKLEGETKLPYTSSTLRKDVFFRP